MLTVQEMQCWECNNPYTCTLECRIGKDGLVRFFVECPTCGTPSHQLEYNEINRAVQRMLLKNGYKAVATVLQGSIRRKRGV